MVLSICLLKKLLSGASFWSNDNGILFLYRIIISRLEVDTRRRTLRSSRMKEKEEIEGVVNALGPRRGMTEERHTQACIGTHASKKINKLEDEARTTIPVEEDERNSPKI